jgi:hypothetical protein
MVRLTGINEIITVSVAVSEAVHQSARSWKRWFFFFAVYFKLLRHTGSGGKNTRIFFARPHEYWDLTPRSL